MNSKQRRQFERNPTHTIKVQKPQNISQQEWASQVYQMTVWCNKNATTGWTAKTDIWAWSSAAFKFNKSKDAMVFALRWA